MATELNYSHLSLAVMLLLSTLAPHCVAVQSSDPLRRESDQTWTGRRIVSLDGFRDYFVSNDHEQPQLIKPEGLGVNIVAVAQRIEGDRVWIKANGASDAAVGWLNKNKVILLEDAVPYFTSLINRDPGNWDAYFRRAESEHALNHRAAAIADYTFAIKLRPDEPFLYLRRGRSFRTMKACAQTVADFEKIVRLNHSGLKLTTWRQVSMQIAPTLNTAIRRRLLPLWNTRLRWTQSIPLTLRFSPFHISGPDSLKKL